MLSIGAMGHGQGNYYTEIAREDYYHAGGEPPGVWNGLGAEDLGLRGQVDKETLHRLLEGHSPDGLTALIQNAGEKSHQPGWDLTFSAPKSVSTLWSQGDEATRLVIQDAHFGAVKEALTYLEDTASFSRRGKGGREIEPAHLAIATFEHGTSRAQDPQLHTHALVINVATRADGTTGTILSKPIYQHKMAAGALYRAELARMLGLLLGVDIERRDSIFEVRGVAKDLIDAFSTRRQEILEALRERGLDSAQAAAAAALDTRQVKEHAPREALFAAWREQGVAHGFSEPETRRLVRGPKPDRSLEVDRQELVRDAIRRITDSESHFPEREVVRRTAEAAQGLGVGGQGVREAVREYLSDSREIVHLGRWRMEERYTTREMLAIEERLLSNADRLKERAGPSVSTTTLDGVTATRGHLNDEQAAALRHITTGTGRIAVLSGLAGTGKTELLRAARLVWELEGYEVQGAALSGKAARGLQDGAGVQSETLHRTLREIAAGERHVGPKTILVLDEAGMVGTRQMDALLSAVERGGGKVVLVGDERQLQPIEAGGPFKAIGDRIGRAELKEIQRQRDAWARKSVKQLSEGRAREALKAYAERGLLHVADDRKSAMEALIDEWKQGGVRRPEESLIFCNTRAEAAALNRLAQAERRSSGVVAATGIRVDGCLLSEGDRVLFTRNSRLYGVQNGTLGTIETVDARGNALMVRLDGGSRATISIDHYDHIKLGYAVTTHKGQGATVDRALVLVGGPMQDRELSYVQASRARTETRIFAERTEAGDGLMSLARKMEVTNRKTMALDGGISGGSSPDRLRPEDGVDPE